MNEKSWKSLFLITNKQIEMYTTLFKIHRKCSECGLRPNLEVLLNVHLVTNPWPSAPTLSRTRNNYTSDALVLPFLLGHRLSKEHQISLPRNSRLLVEHTHLGLLSRDICLGNTIKNYTSSGSLESWAFIYEFNPVDFLVYFPVLVSLLVHS